MSSSNSPCAACKFLRRKCTQECDFAPYFPADNPQRFICVHRVFGASNVAKLLKELTVSQRDDAVKSLAYEAEARLRDPVYGCVGFISVLQQRLKQIQTDLHNAKKELATYLTPQAMQYFLANPSALLIQQNNSQGNPFMLFPNYPNNIPQPPPVLAGHGGGQLVIRDPQQQELLEAQQLAAAAAVTKEQQQQQVMLQQQQQEFLRFNSGLEPVGSVAVAAIGGGGFGHQMGVPLPSTPVHAADQLPPSLALGTFENVGSYQIHQQVEEQQQQHLVPPQPHHHLPIEAQLLLSPQQSQQQLNQSESEDGRSVGPSSC